MAVGQLCNACYSLVAFVSSVADSRSYTLARCSWATSSRCWRTSGSIAAGIVPSRMPASVFGGPTRVPPPVLHRVGDGLHLRRSHRIDRPTFRRFARALDALSRIRRDQPVVDSAAEDRRQQRVRQVESPLVAVVELVPHSRTRWRSSSSKGAVVSPVALVTVTRLTVFDGSQPRRSDVAVAKDYLTEDELGHSTVWRFAREWLEAEDDRHHRQRTPSPVLGSPDRWR